MAASYICLWHISRTDQIIIIKHSFTMYNTCSVPVGVLMHGLERGLVSQETRDEMRRRKHEIHRLRIQQW